MEEPFSDHLCQIADSMGIALYQRFGLNEGALFLRCPTEDLKRLIKGGNINYISVAPNQFDFFGYQLLEYLLNSTSVNQVSAADQNADVVQKRIIRAKEVQNITGLSRTTLWRMENKGEFPRRVSLGKGSIGWHQHEVESWLKSRSTID